MKSLKKLRRWLQVRCGVCDALRVRVVVRDQSKMAKDLVAHISQRKRYKKLKSASEPNVLTFCVDDSLDVVADVVEPIKRTRATALATNRPFQNSEIRISPGHIDTMITYDPCVAFLQFRGSQTRIKAFQCLSSKKHIHLSVK